MTQTFAYTLVPGPNWAADVPTIEQSGHHDHAAYLARLHQAGQLRAAGLLRQSDAALLVLEVETEAEARAIIEADPWVRSGMREIGFLDAWTVRFGTVGGA